MPRAQVLHWAPHLLGPALATHKLLAVYTPTDILLQLSERSLRNLRNTQKVLSEMLFITVARRFVLQVLQAFVAYITVCIAFNSFSTVCIETWAFVAICGSLSSIKVDSFPMVEGYIGVARGG